MTGKENRKERKEKYVCNIYIYIYIYDQYFDRRTTKGIDEVPCLEEEKITTKKIKIALGI
jgi:hypothetical protein